MYFAFLDMQEAILGFMARGGGLLWLIGCLLLIMWTMIFERLWYLNFIHKVRVKHALSAWSKRQETRSWNADQIRSRMVSELSIDLKAPVPLIESLVVICPLLGLLGTVTGMMEVFQVMTLTGGGDAKSMAGGVSKATIPTMAGMVGALSGIFAVNLMKHRFDREIKLLEDNLA